MSHPPLLGCIADDVTGATDLANNLVRSGMRTVQTIGVPKEPLDQPADAIVVSLKSRTIAPAEAVAQSLAALRWLQAQGVEQIYFKYCSTFDSTPQGNIGPVIEALLDALHGPGQGFTIACPAFPQNKRTVFKGHLFAGDALLNESGMQNHPLTPMTDANLVRVLQAQSRRKVGLASFEVVAQGPKAIEQRFAELQDEGVGIAVLDAVSDEDLIRIGPALAGMKLVTAGSGIAIGLPQNWGKASGAGADALPPSGGLRAVISGSCSAATNEQVRAFINSGGPAFAVSPLDIADGEDVVGLALRWAAQHIANGSVLIYATAEPAEVKATQAKLGVAQAGEMVEAALSAIARGLVERQGVRQLVVAGGETSGAVVQALAVQQLVIGPQIDPGVPWTAARSPAVEGQVLHLALKSGNFGSREFFTQAFEKLNLSSSSPS